MKTNVLTLLCLGLTASVYSGDYYSGKEPVSGKMPIEECVDLGGEIFASYQSTYIIHGLRINEDTVSGGVNYSFDALIPLTFGASHHSGITPSFPWNGIGAIDLTELSLSTTFEDVAGFSIELGYTQRFLSFTNSPIDLDGSYGEVFLELRRDLGFADFIIGSNLGLNSRNSFFAAGGGDGWVHHAGLEKSFSLCESADLVISGGVGYHDGYYFGGGGTSDWSHYYLGASLPMTLNCRTTLTPYIGYNGVQQWGVFAPQGDAFHGGVSLNVAF